MQGACYNQLATTVYTLAACQQSRKQHHTRAVVCPRCITAVAFYLVVGYFCYRILRSVGLRASAAVWYMHAVTGSTTHMFHNVVIWYHMRMIPIACRMFFNLFLRHSPRHGPEGEPCIYTWYLVYNYTLDNSQWSNSLLIVSCCNWLSIVVPNFS